MRSLRAASALLAAGLGACSLAPPVAIAPGPAAAAYREAGPWVAAQPADRLPRDQWWLLYRSDELPGLVQRLIQGNPSLAAALANEAQAVALRDQARAGYFPSVGLNAGASRLRDSAHAPLVGPTTPRYYDNDVLGASVSYEVDLWGQIRNEVAAGEANAAAAAADLENARLSLIAQLVDAYVQLRGLDRQAALIDDTVIAYERALELTRKLHNGGIIPGLDVSEAQTQLSTARADAAQTRAQRALMEHAIAALLGLPASDFALAPAQVDVPVPAIPVGVPSTLLQRRPDVAAAQRRMMAASAGVGVARAAYFPSLTLGAQGGYQSTAFGNLLSAPSRFWAIGPNALLTVFDGGLHAAQVAQARAVLDASAADYRGVTVAAFQQVEDSLAQLHYDGEAALQERDAVTAASHSLDLSLALYRQGAAAYLTVITSQTALLQAQLQALSLQTLQLRASVSLIRALGGGWQDPAAAGTASTAAN